jgi:hypothetical protein
MPAPTAALTRILLLATAATLLPAAAPRAQTPPAHEIPQAIRLAHEEDIKELNEFAVDTGALGVAARHALDLVKKHHAREEEYIMPPLTLLSAVTEGKITKDMAWAVAMADRIKATREEIFEEHTAITDAMNNLLLEASLVRNQDAIDYALNAVADSLEDMEVEEPAAIMVGEVIRAKLAAP